MLDGNGTDIRTGTKDVKLPVRAAWRAARFTAARAPGDGLWAGPSRHLQGFQKAGGAEKRTKSSLGARFGTQHQSSHQLIQEETLDLLPRRSEPEGSPVRGSFTLDWSSELGVKLATPF